MNWTLIVAVWGAVWATAAIVWNIRQDRARKPRLALSFVDTKQGWVRLPNGGSQEDPSRVSALRLRVANLGEEAPLTVIEIGCRRRNSRVMIPCDYISGPWMKTSTFPYRASRAQLTLLAGGTEVVDVSVEDLGSSAELTGVYARCSRGHVAWLPRKTLRALVRDHSWPSAASASGETHTT